MDASMRKLTTILLIFGLLIVPGSCALFKGDKLKPSDLERIAAVKDLMNSSIYRAMKLMSQLNNDNPDGVLPTEINVVLGELRKMGLGQYIDPVTNEMARISNLMVEETQVILLESVQQIRINDAAAIILGGQNAATQVLRNNMKTVVRDRYAERIDILLDNQDINTYWPLAARLYNSFSQKKIEPNLSLFLSESAVDVAFVMMGQQEQELRNQPAQIGTDVALKVFEYYQNKK